MRKRESASEGQDVPLENPAENMDLPKSKEKLKGPFITSLPDGTTIRAESYDDLMQKLQEYKDSQ